MTRQALILLLALLLLTGCDRGKDLDAGTAGVAQATSAATPASSHRMLPTAKDAAGQPQPALETLSFAPVVQDFAPGQLQMHAPKVDVAVRRVSYGPYGMAIDLQIDQRKGDYQTFLNGGDKGVLRDDAGGVYRLKEDAHMLNLHMGKAGDTWKATLHAYGFVPADARTMTLSLNVASFGADDAMVQAHWPIPAAVKTHRRLLAEDVVEAGRGWRFAVPPTAMGAEGKLGVRVYGVHWLRDGIALDMDLVNGVRGSSQPLYGVRLVDEHGRVSRMLQHKGSSSVMRMGKDERQTGRFLFTPQVAPDAHRLVLQIEDIRLDLGAIPPAAMPGLPMPTNADRSARYVSYREEAPTFPLANSQLDRVAELKRDLHAQDETVGTRVALPGDVLFDFDKASLRPDAAGTLDKLAELISRVNRPVHITGYTDSKGDDAYNLALSQKRATSVHEALRERGVQARLLVDTRGRGEADPKAPNAHPDGSDDPAGRQRNRRVEVLIEPSGDRAD